MKASKILKKVKKFANKDNWQIDVLATNKRGQWVDCNDPDAIKFCIMGYLMNVTDMPTYEEDRDKDEPWWDAVKYLADDDAVSEYNFDEPGGVKSIPGHDIVQCVVEYNNSRTDFKDIESWIDRAYQRSIS